MHRRSRKVICMMLLLVVLTIGCGGSDGGSDMPGTFCNSDADCAANEECLIGMCTPLVCGDGIVATDEDCDDGNSVSGDGCSDCLIDDGWSCIGEPSVCAAACGDGLVALTAGEQCDDGNTISDDGCSNCLIDDGWSCIGEPSVCAAACGDGLVALTAGEQCDDGNSVSGDGCSNCLIDDGWSCIGEPSVCAPPPDGAPCDDGITCTTNDVYTGGLCAGTVTTNSCLIGGICYHDGDGTVCAYCDPASTQIDWTLAPAGNQCDFPACTAYGSCTGFTSTCDETGTQSRTCTERICSGDGACSNGASYKEDRDCSRNTEGLPCGPGQVCSAGSCISGEPR